MPDKEEVQEAMDALEEVYRLRNESISNAELVRRIEQLARDLAAKDTGVSKYGGIRKTVAEAILKTYLRKELHHLSKP